jgi:hypothetical protein
MTNLMRAVLFGGLACAILDGAAATITFLTMGVSFTRLWQGVASGLLGRASFQHGGASAALGLFFHVLIAMVAALVFNLAIQYLPSLLQHYLMCGALYGVLVFLFMNFVVIPLSAMPRGPFDIRSTITQVIIHIFCVGLPISIAASRFLSK